MEAERQSRIALSRQLAAQSQAMVLQQPKLIERAGLLAIEAAQLYTSLETDQALRAVLALLPRAHSSVPSKGDVQELAFQPSTAILSSWRMGTMFCAAGACRSGRKSGRCPLREIPIHWRPASAQMAASAYLKSSSGSSAYETATGRLITKDKQTAAFN